MSAESKQRLPELDNYNKALSQLSLDEGSTLQRPGLNVEMTQPRDPLRPGILVLTSYEPERAFHSRRLRISKALRFATTFNCRRSRAGQSHW